MTDEPTLLGERYQLGEVLGRGGMAEVRRARDTRLGRDVAIKTLRADLAGDTIFQTRFRREAQSAAGLNHPTIVSVYDTGVRKDLDSDVDIPYIVMELVEGSTLRDVLRDGRRILPERALEITQGVLDALSYSHKAGIIHRDIKPANVMLTKAGAVKVMDFGIARAVSDTAATMTQTAAVIGTAQYLSPEQARGETVDARSDIYSAGCLLYELLTGRPPFQGDSPVSVAYQHVRETPVAPSKIDGGDPEITPAMDAITLKALAKDPTDRYQSAKEMRDDISRLLAGQHVNAVIPPDYIERPQPVLQPTPAETPTRVMAAPVPQRAYPSEVPTPAKHRSPARTALVALIMLSLLAVVGYGIFAWLGPNKTISAAPSVEVQRVIGLQQEAARSILTNQGLRIEAEPIKGPKDQTLNTVIEQNPVEGTRVPRGSTVRVKINVGPDSKAIPSVKGKQITDARRILEDAGFTHVSERKNPVDDVTAVANQVTDVQPAEGSAVALDTEIVLLYDDGTSLLPNLKGFTEKDARARLKALGFTDVQFDPVTVYSNGGSTQPNGIVLDQDPLGEQDLPRTTKITLRVSQVVPSPIPTTVTPAPPSSGTTEVPNPPTPPYPTAPPPPRNT